MACFYIYIYIYIYKGDTQSDRTLPQIPHTDIEYEEPAVYTQLETSNRTPIEENCQSLSEEGYEPLQTYQNENILQYASLNTFDNPEKLRKNAKSLSRDLHTT